MMLYLIPSFTSDQDHICAAVAITKRDTFMSEAKFKQLLYLAFGNVTRKDIDINSERKVVELQEPHLNIPPPALLKPKKMWTGKQAKYMQCYLLLASLYLTGCGAAYVVFVFLSLFA